MTNEREPTGRHAAAVSTPPKGVAFDEEYVRSSLRAIKLAQATQAEIEAERTGASKTTSRLVTVFGTLITAAAIGGFAWVWNANATNAVQEVELGELATNPPSSHGHDEIIRAEHRNESDISSLKSSYSEINRRLDRMEREAETRHAETLEELRRIRGSSSRRRREH